MTMTHIAIVLGCGVYLDPNTAYKTKYLEPVLADILTSDKKLTIKSVDGPVGVCSRNFSNAQIYTTGWHPQWKLIDGIKKHCSWVSGEANKKYGKKSDSY